MIDFNDIIKVIILIYILISIIFVFTHLGYEIKYKSMYKGGRKFKAALDSKLRGKKVLLWPLACLSGLFLISWLYIVALVFDIIFKIHFLTSLENRQISTWLGVYPTAEFDWWFLLAIVGTLGTRSLSLLGPTLATLLDSSLVINEGGSLDYKKKL